MPNSVTREMAARLFRGKSKQLYDYLWSQSRGAITPTRIVRRSRPQLLRGAGYGSMGTVERCIDFLIEVGLIKVRTIVGEAEGNEYEVFTPEEVAPALLGLTSPTGITSETGITGSTLNQVLPVIPETGTTGSTLSSTDSAISGGPKTSFKTEGEKLDDEAFAGFISLLKQAAKDVTGKETSPAEADRWAELAQVLAEELKRASSRTAVSSAPAFLAEHLRRRLSRPAAAPSASAKPEAGPPPPLPAPEPPSDEDLIGMFVNLLHSGLTIEDIESQFLGSVAPERWAELKPVVLERFEAEKAVTGTPAQG